MTEDDMGGEARNDDTSGTKKFADTVDKNDPHKTEKLANVGKDTDASESSE
jgi:hypothetical protein